MADDDEVGLDLFGVGADDPGRFADHQFGGGDHAERRQAGDAIFQDLAAALGKVGDHPGVGALGHAHPAAVIDHGKQEHLGPAAAGQDRPLAQGDAAFLSAVVGQEHTLVHQPPSPMNETSR